MKHVAWVPEKIKPFFHKYGLLIVLAVLGVLLILLTSGNTSNTTIEQSGQDFCQEYVKDLEGKLSNMICEVAGVKNCTVMITLKTGVEYVYATDESENINVNTQGGDKKEQSEEKVTIVTDKQVGEKAVIVTERYPQINGVSIICHVPDSPTLTLAVKNIAATALGVDSGKVCVILKG